MWIFNQLVDLLSIYLHLSAIAGVLLFAAVVVGGTAYGVINHFNECKGKQ